MRLDKIFNLLIISFLLASCSEEVPAYREIWQKAHHLDDARMVEFYGEPGKDKDNMLGAILEAVDGNWGKVADLTEGSRPSDIYAYYHNLAMAMEGCLADSLMYYYQPFERGLFLPVGETSGQLRIAASSEVWYRLGEMTMAEHSAMLAQIFSPEHFGVPYLKRLAEINLVNGQDEAARKYLRLLSKEDGCGKWVADRIPGQQSKAVKEQISYVKSLVPKSDAVHSPYDYRGMLKNLLASNPDNQLARQYLLCLDILVKDLVHFIEDYDPSRDRSRLYDEAVLIFLAQRSAMTPENIAYFGLSEDVLQDFSDYNNMVIFNQGAMEPMQEKYGKTYWFFYQYAKRNNK
ncbi:MAG: hypothetical protein IJN52_00970 [Bacteroidales bacterium]|nr:hypothetical protein [Bacteroidales bacterium]